VLGLYEHELNGWLRTALPRVSRLIDVGANDGYFAFGFAAALRRDRRPCEIICFEPQPQHVAELRRGLAVQPPPPPELRIVEALAGASEGLATTTLDALAVADHDRTLIKIDVEGAEQSVVEGAGLWLRPSNAFLIEVHRASLVGTLTRLFAERGLTLRQIDQRALPVVGREQRDLDNRWLVSEWPQP
jgi:hypothetical protein